uniref:Uncharacterized protein n=1 Tax=Romanomermis culicivorax TaxID=13658 RepID=A0A915J610_ROMCU
MPPLMSFIIERQWMHRYTIAPVRGQSLEGGKQGLCQRTKHTTVPEFFAVSIEPLALSGFLDGFLMMGNSMDAVISHKKIIVDTE